VDHPTLKNLILLAGDGDFTDMVKLMKETYNVRVFIVAWSASVNFKISELASNTIYLDEIFETISVANRGGNPSNAERLRKLPELKFSACVIEAATYKYPDEHDFDKCLDFALQLL